MGARLVDPRSITICIVCTDQRCYSYSEIVPDMMLLAVWGLSFDSSIIDHRIERHDAGLEVSKRKRTLSHLGRRCLTQQTETCRIYSPEGPSDI